VAGPEEPLDGPNEALDVEPVADPLAPAPTATTTKPEPEKKRKKGAVAFLGELPVLLLIASVSPA
jgi:hypothetical protein